LRSRGFDCPMQMCRGIVLALCYGYAITAATADGFVSGFLHDLAKEAPSVSDVEKHLADASSDLEDSESNHSTRTSSVMKGMGSVFGDVASEAVHEARHFAGNLADKAKHVAEKAREEAHSLADSDWVHLEDENELEGNSKAYNNMLLMALFIIVALAAVVGHFLDVLFCPADLRARGHPRGWVVAMLLVSYGMLIPAIQSTLFSFNIFMNIKIGSMGDMGYNMTRHPVTESMLSVIGLLLRTGGRTGACCVILYAMVLPAVKVVLLVLGELWRNSENETFQRISSTCILLVQITSKWATPDLFAYILLLFLFRHLNHPPLVSSKAVLDTGFCCFGVFCLCSTFSTLAIHRPVPMSGRKGTNAVYYTKVSQSQEPAILERLGRERALLVVCLLEVLFAILLIAGVLTPCMGLHLDTTILLKPKGPVPKSMAWMIRDGIDALDLRPLLRAEVSLWHCLSALSGYIVDGEAACIMAFIMLAVFAVSLTVADMVMLALAANAFGGPGPNTAMAVSRVLKHISMLDVFCMGVFVVCMAGQAYSSVGFNLGLRPGLLPLVAAEALHYLTYHLVSSAAGTAEDSGGSDESALAAEDKLLGIKMAADE